MKVLSLLFAFIQHLKIQFRINVFKRRFYVLNKKGKKFKLEKSDYKLVVVIAHVVPDPVNALPDKLERLVECLDALGKSLNAFHSKIILLSKKDFSLHEQLPEYWKKKIEIYYSPQEDPMFVEYDAYDVFLKYKENFDYFIFMEDDVLLTDSWFLEKIKKFNYYSPYKNYVLTPHRFEYSDGIKYFFDQMIVKEKTSTSYMYSDKLRINFEDASFTVFQNPHAAFYCLSKEQMQLWADSGYKWKNKVVAFGVLESAATFSLYENFEFFKPHPDNMGYFEVQHYGNKYMLKHKVIQVQNPTA